MKFFYAPTDDAGNAVKDEFNNSMVTLLSKINPHKEIITLGDLNASGNKCGLVINVSVMWSIDRVKVMVNDSGERLIDLCVRFSLRILNCFFDHNLFISILGTIKLWPSLL